MCLYVKSNAKVKTADKPILVWKFVMEYTFSPDAWASPYFTYVGETNKYGELVIAKKIVSYERQPLEDLKFEPVYHFKYKYKNLWVWFRCNSSYRNWDINPKEKAVQEGLHAFCSKHRAKRRRTVDSIVRRPAIIPVGARYVKGKNREIVSTQMIVCKTLEDAKRIMNEQKGK